MLPPELQSNEGIKRFEKDGKFDFPGFAKSYSEAQSLIGRYQTTNLTVPGKDAKPEDWNPIYQKLGWPEKHDDYKIPEVEGRPYTEQDKAFQAQTVPELHKLRLTQEQVTGVVTLFNGLQTKAIETVTAALATGTAALKKDWGGDYDKNLDTANRGLREIAALAKVDVEELKHMRFADGSYAGDHPAFVRMFNVVGAKLLESGFNGNSPGAGGGAGGGGDPFASPATAKAELDRLYTELGTNAQHPYNNKKDPSHKQWRDRVMRLTELSNKKAS